MRIPEDKTMSVFHQRLAAISQDRDRIMALEDYDPAVPYVRLTRSPTQEDLAEVKKARL